MAEQRARDACAVAALRADGALMAARPAIGPIREDIGLAAGCRVAAAMGVARIAGEPAPAVRADRGAVGHRGADRCTSLARRADDDARAYFDESIILYRSIEAWQPLGYVLLNRGVVAGDRRHAKALVEEAIALFGQIGYRGSMLALALTNLGHLLREEGDVEQAAGRFKESLELCWTGRYAWVLPYALEGLGDVALACGARERGARLFGAAEAIRAEAGAAVRPTAYPEYYQAMAAARALLSQPAFAAAWAEGQALPVEEAVAEAFRVASRVADAPAVAAAPFGTAPVLSPRERDVLRLVAAGRTDREIADALFVSHHTVANHVRHILDKLDVSTRAAAVAVATQAGWL
jgi:DNA-binding CsgD family transcriptional regulator